MKNYTEVEEKEEEEEEEPHVCDSNPCMNGGTCQDEGLGYDCNCPLDVTGDLCINGNLFWSDLGSHFIHTNNV